MKFILSLNNCFKRTKLKFLFPFILIQFTAKINRYYYFYIFIYNLINYINMVFFLLVFFELLYFRNYYPFFQMFDIEFDTQEV
jgi:hypothetical protein